MEKAVEAYRTNLKQQRDASAQLIAKIDDYINNINNKKYLEPLEDMDEVSLYSTEIFDGGEDIHRTFLDMFHNVRIRLAVLNNGTKNNPKELKDKVITEMREAKGKLMTINKETSAAYMEYAFVAKQFSPIELLYLEERKYKLRKKALRNYKRNKHRS